MNIFKISPESTEFHYIDKETVEIQTEKKPPYYQRNLNSDTISHYAVCPACDNPIQIIGLYKKLGHTEEPYGKHFPRTILGLAEYSDIAYINCPFHRRNRASKNSRKTGRDAISDKVVGMLIQYFDKVIYFLQKKMGIFISDKLAESMLRYYFDSEGYLYLEATVLNVPLIFAYFSGTYNLYGRIIFDKVLKEDLLTNKSIHFKDNKIKTNNDITFCFRTYRQSQEGLSLGESIMFSVSIRTKNNTIRNIHSKKIDFDPKHWQNLLNYQAPNLSEEQSERNTKLKQMALLVAEEYGFNIN